MPESFAESSDGTLYFANGIDKAQRWDGLSASSQNAGLDAPTTTPTFTGSGIGGIVGKYKIYTRWVSSYGTVSNLSPVSTEGDVAESEWVVGAATNTTPITIQTTTTNSLVTGQTVLIRGVGGNTAANTITTVTVVDASTFNLDGTSGNGTYTGGGVARRGRSTLSFASIQAPTDTRITKRQILRNTHGQYRTFYVDVETTNLTATTFSSTNTDATLLTNEAVALFDIDGRDQAVSRYTAPPSHKALIAHHQGRMFLAGEVSYSDGCCQVTNGSTIVTGVDTNWKSTFKGRSLYIQGATARYEISSADSAPAVQTMILTAAYTGTTDKFAQYSVRPAPAERRLIYFSEALLPEAWPPTNTISLQEDGDEITGLMVKSSFLYILEKAHIYRLVFKANPIDDGQVFLAGLRGCINNRCWVLVEDTAYMLDEAGVYGFRSSKDMEVLSAPIQDVFQPGGGEFRINWKASKWFHAQHFPGQDTIRWFVALSGGYLPRHALTYDYRRRRWWIEEYPLPAGSSAKVTLDLPRTLVGSEARKIRTLWHGTLDGPDPAGATVRGIVTSAGPDSLSDSVATFPTAGVVGAPLVIVAGMGKGQSRLVASVSGTKLVVTQPWLIQPDTTSTYQLGGVTWRFRSKWFKYLEDEAENVRRLAILFQPAAKAVTMDARVFQDLSDTALTWSSDYSSDDTGGFSSEKDKEDLVADLTKSIGYVQRRFDGHRERYSDGPRYISFELSGATNEDTVTLYGIEVGGVTK